MDHIFSVRRKPPKGIDSFYLLDNSLICTISSTNVIAFTTNTKIEENNIRTYGSHVYVADLNTPWLAHRVYSSPHLVTVLQWDFTAELLLLADECGHIRIYKSKDHLLNDWQLFSETSLDGEHILAAAFFHSGKKICLNLEKKESSSYTEKFQNVKFSCSVKKFGSRPCNGALILTTTGMLAAILLPHPTSQSQSMIVATESLAATRIQIKTADICYGKNGHFLLAVSNGETSTPIQCFNVAVTKGDEKCNIISQSLPSFFLSDDGKDIDHFKNIKAYISHIKWVMREDADSLVVAACYDGGSYLQAWELHEKTFPVHELLAGSEPKYYNTVIWQYQSNFQHNHKVVSLATSKLTILNNVSSNYIVAAFADNSIHCLNRDSLKILASTSLHIVPANDEPLYRKPRTIPDILHIDMSWLGNILLVIDVDGFVHMFKLLPQIDNLIPLSVPYATTILEYCLITGLDWLDLLLVLRPTMLDALCDRLTESFNKQTPATQQFFYLQYLCIKTSLYRLSSQGHNKAIDLTLFLMLQSISTAFKSLLRPSETSSHEKSPADSLTSVINEGQGDVDKVLMNLEAKEFTVEPYTLQSLQQLIQWVADLALNLLVKLPDSRPTAMKPYELVKDVKALNTLREMLVLIRIWGLLRPACLPVFTKSDATLDVLSLLFRLLSRLIQNVNEPDDLLIDECLLLPSQVQIQPLQQQSNRVVLASPQLAQQILPLQLEFQNEPDCLASNNDLYGGQTVDSIRHLYLGRCPRVVKQCVRCGGSAGTVPVTRTAAIRAWDQRWSRSCQCGGLWRMQVYS
ncbi:mediator of RNA polymerase II transcription subunit 16 isoform X2 [Onthophagus taurus]|uniref:mediator of RNA polymerase II transcription subunit 16 isoform X2 n=1 Tax=Onthophagus taurus TaxID=166361 RepID=UPI0039BE1900